MAFIIVDDSPVSVYYRELDVVGIIMAAVVAHMILARVLGENVPLAARKAGRQHIREGKLVFYLTNSLHISDDLEGTTVHKVETCGFLLFVGGVSNFAGQAGVQPQVDQVGAKGGDKDRPDNRSAHAVLVGGRHKLTAHNRPDW